MFFKVDGEDKAIWGELASTCAKNNGIKATVIYGSARDIDALLYIDYPVFASNFCPNAGSALGLGTVNETIEVEGIEINPGDFFFGDESRLWSYLRNCSNRQWLPVWRLRLRKPKLLIICLKV